MGTDHLRFHVRGVHAKMFSEMDAKSQAVEECAGAEDAIVTCHFAGNIGERIGRIGDSDQHCLRSGPYNLRDNVSIDRSVLFEQPEPSLRIVAVRGTACFLVHSRSNEHRACAGQRVVVTVLDIDLREIGTP